MQDSFPLTVRMVLEHGRRVYGRSEVVTWEGDHARRSSFAEIADNAGRPAVALAKLGIGPGDRVGTLCWNHQEHVEAYYAVPCMGAVLHTLNIRLPGAQFAHHQARRRQGGPGGRDTAAACRPISRIGHRGMARP